MALSGSFQSAIGSYYTFRVEWTATQDIPQNRSAVTFRAYLEGHNIGSSTATGIASRSGNPAQLNGSAYTWDAAAVSKTGNFTLQLGSKTITVNHAADGTKSFSASFTWNCRFTTDGAYRASVTAGGTVALTTIPRTSGLTLAPTTQAIGEDVGITITRASSTFTHTLSYAFQGLTGTIAEDTTLTLLSWTLPAAFRAKFTDRASLTGKITCTTKSGTSTVGSAEAVFTATLAEEDKPVISSVAVTPSGSPSGFTDVYLQNKSSAAVTVTATGETALTYRATLDGKTYSGASFTADVFTTPGDHTLTLTVTDARGLKDTETRTLSVLPYGAPYLLPYQGESEVGVFRANAAGERTSTGAYLAVRGGRALYSLDGDNQAGVTMEVKAASAAAYDAPVTLLAPSAAQTAYFNRVFDLSLTDRAYQVRLTVTDLAGGTQAVVFSVPCSLPTLDLRAGGLGAAFGKYAASDSLLDSAWPIRAPGLTLETTPLPLTSGGTGAGNANGALSALTERVSGYLAPGALYTFQAPSPKSVYLIVCTDKNNPGAWLAGGGNNQGSSYAITIAASALMSVTAGASADDTITLTSASAQYNANYMIIRLA